MTNAAKIQYQPGGVVVDLLTYLLSVLFFSVGATRTWNLYRELYCRSYHETSQILCSYIDWDFRIDAFLVFAGAAFAYSLFHIWKVRRAHRRFRFLVLIVCVVFVAVIALVSSLVPGEWEAWALAI